MRIGVVGLAHHHDGGFVPAAAGHVARLATAHHLGEVFLSTEKYFYILVQASTAIETGVDDDAFAVVVFSQDVRVDGTETVVSHRLDVHVTQSATRPSVNVCRTLFHPAAVE